MRAGVLECVCLAQRARERERWRVRKLPNVEALRTGFLVGLDHLFGCGLGVLREIHNDKPVVVVATFEQYRIRPDFLGAVAIVC